MDPEVENIVAVLQAKKLRATYGSVAQYLRVPSLSVGNLLGRKCQLASWIVNSKTGMPTGYSPTQMHPELKSQARIIKTEDELMNEIK